MPTTPLPEKITAMLRRPNPAVMATLAKDGRPVTVATWYLLDDDGTVLLSLDAERARLDHMRRDPRVSLTALDEDSWYTQVSVQGRVVSIDDDVELAGADRISTHYTGHPYADRERPRVIARVELDRWHAWGALRDD
ncbi:PPOX class probable F420-dependent enzyme [Friedmanniella endophytica]|uniref:PPOX class probable F420-dependent enzyme n=1 Tax=Microlunatus kandeliicorticis TaxID=1759536 RepID=A0A7W3IPQ9_9ACTN|nr:TIGR03618 family F420-dependent PPOX class oxidoreductase [Microlunatus kandeliicorticis]MBA8792981.1 PPOX class probable F420-dependent enzyme [Microlunatus kandeliicorticis]